MATIKIYPPKQLPIEGVTESAFNIWKEELEIYIDLDTRFQKFLPGGRYETWEAAESCSDRIRTPKPEDVDNITTYRKELRQFLAIIAKLIHPDYFNPILRHSTSLEWIYTRIRQDYNLEQQGIFFLNILDIKWDETAQTTPIGLYNNYRSLIMGNLGQSGDKIHWQNTNLKEDEKLTPSHEDLILVNVLQIMHPKLPIYIKELYAHKIGKSKRLMDFKTEILNKSRQFIEEIREKDNDIHVSQINTVPEDCAEQYDYDDQDPSCNYVNNSRFKPRFSRDQNRQPYRQRFQPSQPNFQTRPYQSKLPPFCRLCQLSNQPRPTYTNHYMGEDSCPSMSQRDKTQLVERITAKLGQLNVQDNIETEYGYPPIMSSNEQQVLNQSLSLNQNSDSINQNDNNSITFSNLPPGCNYIKPVPAQILTVTDKQGKNVHLDLDTGATVSYIKLSTAKEHNFTIRANSQLSNLADGKTKLQSAGEVDEQFYRNNFKVRFHAIVTENLHCNFVAGNNFFQENNVIQDINNKTITIHGKYNVPETNKLLILTTSTNNMILKNNHINTVLPGQSVTYKVPHPDSQLLAVQPCHQNKQELWPPPQLCKVNKGFISVHNTTPDIISLKHGNDKVQARTMDDHYDIEPKCFSSFIPSGNEDKYKSVHINTEGIDSSVIKYIREANENHKEVFNEDLSGGYNMAYGKHRCNLNWANESRPPANKVNNINYDHDTKVLLQQVCDEFTQAGVLGIPSEHNIQIQHASPAFLVRKQRAKNKPKAELTTKDVRLVVNFGNLNDCLKNIPTPITKPKDIFIHLGRWKYIIVMDLFQGFFQNHMAKQDGQWLGISTPFGGLRFMQRSGQGLIGQSEELDEMLSKVLSSEMQSGSAARIADDLYIGGSTPLETAKNYDKVLSKLKIANLKVSADKTKIFLESVDILGWIWKKGGFLSPSPHRVNALKNTSYEDITCIKDLRSWLGLYKTMMPSAPNLTLMLDPFDKIVAGKDSKDSIEWDATSKMAFIKAKEAIDSMQTLYLPSPDDQLLLVVDAAKTKPGLGHILYAIKNNQKLPVSFHSNKLSETHSKWHSCELEALAFSTAITAEYNTLKESRKPVIIAPDSKAVADAVNLIRKGQHSSNPRIQALITNVNRIPLIVQLASGKNKLNACGDNQSRFPSPCQVEHCAICNFVAETTNTINPFAINAVQTLATHLPAILENKAAWKSIQDDSKSCQQAIFYVTSGKTPSKQSGKLYSEIRRLASVAKINANGLLVVYSKPNTFSLVRYEQTVIPSSHLPAVLWQMHNTFNHPTKSQLKSQFERSFYSVGLHPELDKLYEDCHFCASQKKIPSIVPHYSKTETKVPGTHFHADVIRRKCQNILAIRDNFSSYTVAKIIRSENNKDLKDGIIELLTPIKLAGDIIVKVDNATGFKPLLDNKDPDLNKLGITITATDSFNINANAVIDKACYELEQELIRIEPDGRQVSNTTIQYATQLLNRKLRRNGSISAFEIYFNRDINNGNNLNLDYSLLKEQQHTNRDMHNQRHNKSLPLNDFENPQPGDLVVTKSNKIDKHKAKDIFMVSASQNDKVKIQRVLHTHTNQPSLRNQMYVTDRSRLHVTRSTTRPYKKKATVHTKLWSPTQDQPDTSSDDDYHVVPPVRVAVNTAPASPMQPLRQSSPIQPLSPPSTSSTPSPSDRSRPQVYQQLDQWITNQRVHAAEQLSRSVDSEYFTQNESSSSPSDMDATVHEEHNPSPDKRALIKANAKKKISAIYHKNMPQIDGAITDSSAPSSSNVSPEMSLLAPPSIPLLDDSFSLYCSSPEFVTADDQESIFSQWDYHEVHELDNNVVLDEVFDTPHVDTTFLARHASI